MTKTRVRDDYVTFKLHRDAAIALPLIVISQLLDRIEAWSHLGALGIVSLTARELALFYVLRAIIRHRRNTKHRETP